VRLGELAKTHRQFHSCLRAQPVAVVGGEAATPQHRALTQDPLDVALREGVGFAPRTSARNCDANASVKFDAKQISARPAMAYEVDGCDCAGAGRGGLSEWQTQLHGGQDNRFSEMP
jgi:hypothetical protein